MRLRNEKGMISPFVFSILAGVFFVMISILIISSLDNAESIKLSPEKNTFGGGLIVWILAGLIGISGLVYSGYKGFRKGGEEYFEV